MKQMYNPQIPTANKKQAHAEIYGTFGEHFQASTNKDGSMNPDKLNLISPLIATLNSYCMLTGTAYQQSSCQLLLTVFFSYIHDCTISLLAQLALQLAGLPRANNGAMA